MMEDEAEAMMERMEEKEKDEVEILDLNTSNGI